MLTAEMFVQAKIFEVQSAAAASAERAKHPDRTAETAWAPVRRVFSRITR